MSVFESKLCLKSNVGPLVPVTVMELSLETPDDIYSTYKKPRGEVLRPQLTSLRFEGSTEIIDPTEIILEDDDCWLQRVTPTTDLSNFLYSKVATKAKPSSTAPKDIDTRTFTRPKKRYTHPSIEKYNEALYEPVSEAPEVLSKPAPLHFEVGQTISTSYFDNMAASNITLDSFQNMSPPSLVNSLCSSTFANLMESSFIKDDPVLREIRDTDFTGSVLQKEHDLSILKSMSMTESFSSLNSDIPENFLRKVAFEEENEEDKTIVLNTTFKKQIDDDDDDEMCQRTMVIANPSSPCTKPEDQNGTFKLRSANNTFQYCKTERPVQAPPVESSNNEEDPHTPPNQNSTITILSSCQRDKTLVIENVKRLLDRRPSPSPDLNRLSYVADGGATYINVNNTLKRNSFGSTDSGENLEYMSLSSSSSKISEPPEIFSIAQTSTVPFQQVMSTPKPRSRTPSIWPNNEISPIRDRSSDPEMSSSDISPLPESSLRKQKSVGNLGVTMVRSPKRVVSKMAPPAGYGISQQKPKSNLNSMGRTLKGSYTSLRPTNAILPVAPPPLDATITRNPAVVQVFPQPREVARSQNAQYVKPPAPRSGLPRPVTGIPRPVSRIPGPCNVRPVSKSAGPQGRH